MRVRLVVQRSSYVPFARKRRAVSTRRPEDRSRVALANPGRDCITDMPGFEFPTGIGRRRLSRPDNLPARAWEGAGIVLRLEDRGYLARNIR